MEASFKDVVNEIERSLGKPLSRHTTPNVALRLALWAALAKSRIDGNEPALAPERYGRAVGNLLCDDRKAPRELGYSRTDLRTMLAETIDSLRQQHLLEDHTAAEVAERRRHRLGRDDESGRGAVVFPSGGDLRIR